MRAIPWLLCIVSHLCTVKANVEKTIFLGPPPVTLPNAHPNLEDLRLDVLSPTHKSVLETQLPVQFPTALAPRGLESWYILHSLGDGTRYEVRICWPATSPTDFWLETYSLQEVFDNASLLSSLASSSEQRQELRLEDAVHFSKDTPSSVLLLRIQAAASYFSTNRTLMEHPPAVNADIILDPFIFNILPRSLLPIAGYISVVAVGAWFLSGLIHRGILVAATADSSPKSHPD